MLVSNIKSLFFTELDEFQAAYFDNQRLTDVFFDAQTQVYKGLMKQYQLNNEITENLIPLTKKEVINPGSKSSKWVLGVKWIIGKKRGCEICQSRINKTICLNIPYWELAPWETYKSIRQFCFTSNNL